LVFASYDHCEKCNEYKGGWDVRCKQCQLKNNFTNWTSGNKRIDDFIQKMQLKYNGVIFEWIPYNKLIEIVNGDDGFATAIWKDGHLSYNIREMELVRKSYEKVVLKFLCDLQNFTDEFLNEVLIFL
jgi:hypothetical protein